VEWTAEHVAMYLQPAERRETPDSSCPADELEADLGKPPLPKGTA